MKLLNQETVGVGEYRLHFADPEFNLERWMRYLGSVNMVEYGGFPAGRLLFNFAGEKDGEVWHVTAQLTELEDCRVPYPAMDFHDILPRVELTKPAQRET